MESNLRKMFRKFKVLTLDQVSNTYDCSIRTVQRQFAALEVLRSYNKNSRYYTLPDIPQFNAHGIWRYRDIFFSKYGGLRNTVKHLILSSENGLSAREIGSIVNLVPRSFMHHFREMEDIFREKHDGVYVYFSNDPTLYANQRLKRARVSDVQEISDTIAIKILVGYIKHPDSSVGELSTILRLQEDCHVTPAAITKFLSFHDLLKKIPESRR
jgi:hypothetical protein